MTIRRRSTLIGAVLLLAGLLVGAVGYVRHLGYPDGAVFTFLPARSHPVAQQGRVAIFLSGDMGFRAGMGPVIAGHIADAGVPVLGVNSLAAFSRRRSPAQTAGLVEQAARDALARTGARRLVMIGQSFGANMLLAGLERLPPALRARVEMVVLIVPADTMLFRATPGGVFDIGNDGPAAPAAAALDWAPVLCIHGASESGSLCPLWRSADVHSVALPGGHFLNGDSALVATTLLRALPSAPNIAKSSDGAERPAM